MIRADNHPRAEAAKVAGGYAHAAEIYVNIGVQRHGHACGQNNSGKPATLDSGMCFRLDVAS
jgi:hypothetical protein